MSGHLRKLVALDLSSSCTGVAVFDLQTKNLISYRTVKSSTKGLSKLPSLSAKFEKIFRTMREVSEVVKEEDPVTIVIEEVTGGRNRLAQKTLNFAHAFCLLFLREELKKDLIHFIDVGGKTGWRPKLNLRLSDADKKHNRSARAKNKKIKNPKDRIRIIGWKDLSCAFANKRIKGLDLDCTKRVTDGDIADAICVGIAFLGCCENESVTLL